MREYLELEIKIEILEPKDIVTLSEGTEFDNDGKDFFD
jgi:hypothetical protein